MSAWTIESEQINYDLVSSGISEFIKMIEFNEWFEGLFVSASKNIGLVVNLVYDGNKCNDKLVNFTSSFFGLISLESGVYISLNKIDINDYSDSEDSCLDYFDLVRLKDGKIICDKNGNLNSLKNKINSDDDEIYESQDDILTGIQYVK